MSSRKRVKQEIATSEGEDSVETFESGDNTLDARVSRVAEQSRDLEGETTTEDEQEEEDHDDVEKERLQNQKRRESARKYLESLQSSSRLSGKLTVHDAQKPASKEGEPLDRVDAASIDRENIEARLQKDILQAKGKVFRKLASKYQGLSIRPEAVSFLRAGYHTPTSVVFSPDGQHVYGGFKSGEIVQWQVAACKKAFTFARDAVAKKGTKPTGHRGHVLCLAISFDGKYLVSGGSDRLINVWNTESRELAATFSQHRGAVTGLAFQMGTMTLFSCSADRTVKVWTLNEFGYMDTLFGHQDEVVSIDALGLERCVTVGTRDRTVRLWKVSEETQLVFRGSDDAGGSIEVVSIIDNEHFSTGSDSGAISVWGLHKKKPLTTQHNAHQAGHAINCLHSYRLTDLLVSGSDDGFIRFWHIDTETYRKIEQIAQIAVEGCVNSICLSEDGGTLAVAIGQDHRLGRWRVHKNAKNRIALIPLR